jgi:hypothetical protein
MQGHWVGLLVLLTAGAVGGGTAVAEPLLGLPDSIGALGAPWLVCAFAVGSLVGSRGAAAAVGALLLSGATGVHYAAQLYGYGPGTLDYATSMTAAWGISAGLAGGLMATAGFVWRTATGPRRALAAAVPAAALAGEAVLLSRTWAGAEAALALGAELGAAAALLVALSWQRSPLLRTAAAAAVLAFAFALAEAELRGYMRGAGWLGA